MEDDDETYTYLDITGSRIKNKMTSDNAKVIGIKKDTSCVSLLSGKKDIHQLIYDLPQNISKDTHFPIIINKYAQRKYGLNVGNEITLNVNNTSDHYSKALRDPNNTPTPDKFNFKVVGINDTYINEEFYISQDVANYILGLKTHLLDDNTTIQNGPHSYYPDTTKSIQIHGENLSRNRTTSPAMQMATEDELILNDVSHFPTTDYYYDNDGARTKPDGLPINNYPGPDNTDPLKTLINPGVKYDVDNLYDINDNNPETRITNDIDDCNITPYGFNGVFTKNPDGDYLLTNCAAVYSPTGLYPGNDKMSDETLRPLLKYGANLQIASQVLGL
jgi:putative ABC transport system permease protein